MTATATATVIAIVDTTVNANIAIVSLLVSILASLLVINIAIAIVNTHAIHLVVVVMRTIRPHVVNPRMATHEVARIDTKKAAAQAVMASVRVVKKDVTNVEEIATAGVEAHKAVRMVVATAVAEHLAVVIEMEMLNEMEVVTDVEVNETEVVNEMEAVNEM